MGYTLNKKNINVGKKIKLSSDHLSDVYMINRGIDPAQEKKRYQEEMNVKQLCELFELNEPFKEQNLHVG